MSNSSSESTKRENAVVASALPPVEERVKKRKTRECWDISMPTFVIDTNVLVDYPDIIPEKKNKPIQLDDPTIDLARSHTVIPTAVVRELSSFKKEHTPRGVAARDVLRRLENLIPEVTQTTYANYHLQNPVKVGDQLISVLPVHKDFSKGLPFRPADTDMDGQIILATISAIYAINDVDNDGTVKYDLALEKQIPDGNVTLVTNDKGLIIRACARGLRTSGFGYAVKNAYTGRRSVIVDERIYEMLVCDGFVPIEEWEKTMPEEAPLVANEYIEMFLQDHGASMRKQDSSSNYQDEVRNFENIGRYDKRSEAIVRLEGIRDFPVRPQNAGQAMYIDALCNPDIAAVICTGTYGTGKTFLATIYGYLACKNGRYIGVTVVPCRIEDDGVGYLPGDLEEKMNLSVQSVKNALKNYFMIEDKTIRKRIENAKKYGADNKESSKGKRNGPEDENERGADLQKNKSILARLADLVNNTYDNWFESWPIAYARGRDFKNELAIYDEFQDQSRSQAKNLLTRLSGDGKIIIAGDVGQVHAAYLDEFNNGLVYTKNILHDHEMVAQITFTEEEVVRHDLVKEIARREKIVRDRVTASGDEVEHHSTEESAMTSPLAPTDPNEKVDKQAILNLEAILGAEVIKRQNNS